jgi:hypothetical protein
LIAPHALSHTKTIMLEVRGRGGEDEYERKNFSQLPGGPWILNYCYVKNTALYSFALHFAFEQGALVLAIAPCPRSPDFRGNVFETHRVSYGGRLKTLYCWSGPAALKTIYLRHCCILGLETPSQWFLFLSASVMVVISVVFVLECTSYRGHVSPTQCPW